MASWYECKFKYNRENQDGGISNVSETYLVDAVSFTDAETRIYSEIGANYMEFILLKVAKYPVHELIPATEEGGKWYKCKVALVTYDEKTEKEKKQKQTVIVNGNTVKEAYEKIEAVFQSSISDYEIMDIVTTTILEVLPFVEEQRNLRKLEPGTIITNELVEKENLSEN
ncbi:MAG TPA: DUF4494 domain-containing protein [Cytophagales bacterium]|nr:DUF4494 domain-containing protein [Cytophagales bacterium]